MEHAGDEGWGMVVLGAWADVAAGVLWGCCFGWVMGGGGRGVGVWMLEWGGDGVEMGVVGWDGRGRNE